MVHAPVTPLNVPSNLRRVAYIGIACWQSPTDTVVAVLGPAFAVKVKITLPPTLGVALLTVLVIPTLRGTVRCYRSTVVPRCWVQVSLEIVAVLA
jgi:hypothetical protein